jgi:transcriptional regulator with XRE-family HTH domain
MAQAANVTFSVTRMASSLMAAVKPRSHADLLGRLLPIGRELVGERMAGRGLTVTALALQLGVSRKHLSMVLHGHAPLGEALAMRLARSVGLDDDELLDFRHDGIVPGPLASIAPMYVRVLADPTEPIEDWSEP